MPHKGTPIRYGQKQPVRNRQQGAQRGKQASRVADARKKFSPRAYVLYASKKIFEQRSITSHLVAVFWRLSGMANSYISWNEIWISRSAQ